MVITNLLMCANSTNRYDQEILQLNIYDNKTLLGIFP